MKMGDFVWYDGKVMRYSGTKDADGRVELINIKDNSEGIMVNHNKIREVNHETRKALKYFMEIEVIPWQGNLYEITGKNGT